MSISDRLDHAMREAGISSQSALARASGVPQPTINRILKGSGKRGPEAETVKALARACNVSFIWLNEGVGERGRSSEDLPSLATPTDVSAVVASQSISVPLLEQKINGSTPGFGGDDLPENGTSFQISADWVRQKQLDPERLVAMTVAGLSMYPTFKPGDVVVLNRDDTSPVDGALFGVNHGGKALIKRATRDGSYWLLASDNKLPEFQAIRVDEQTRIVGRVVTSKTDYI